MDSEQHDIGNEGSYIEQTRNGIYIYDVDGGEVYLCDGEPELLSERLDEIYGTHNYRPIDDLFDEDGHNENQSLEDNRERYSWFDPNSYNVTKMSNTDNYNVETWVINKDHTYTFVKRIGHNYSHVLIHKKHLENVDGVALSYDFDTVVEQNNSDEDSDETCVCGNEQCQSPFYPSDIEGREYGPNETTPAHHIAEVDERVVTVDTEVSVEDATDDQRQMYGQMASMVEDNFETFVSKNQDYGNSALTTDVGLTEDGPFDSELQSNANGLLVRLSDKQQRLENLLLSMNEDSVGESAVETALDGANYYLMLAWLIDQTHDSNDGDTQ